MSTTAAPNRHGRRREPDAGASSDTGPHRQLPDDVEPETPEPETAGFRTVRFAGAAAGPRRCECRPCAHVGARPCYASRMEASLPIVIGIVVPIIGTVIAGVVALGIMAWRITGRLDRRIDNDKAAADADRRAIQARIDNDKAAADADRRAIQARIDNDKAAADADRRVFQAAMDTFRAEMRRLAERQSHVEGRFDERGSPAD